MTVLLELSPVLVVFVVLLVFRRPPLEAAASGVVTVAILWLSGVGSPLDHRSVEHALLDTSVLFLSTASVIAPGLAFVVLIERLGVNEAVTNWVRDLGWNSGQQVVFVVLGLGPLLEAMTGFGVSLIVTVPLLLGLFPKPVAIRVALTGMAIMPWGTLGLATVVGAALSHLEPSALGYGSALVSAPVFLTMGSAALWLSGARDAPSWLLLVGGWVAFVAVLVAMNHLVGPEFAGVGAGGTVLLLGLVLAGSRSARVGIPSAAWPYAALLVSILLTKVLAEVTGAKERLVVQGAEVTWSPLGSPGVALSAVVIILLLRGSRGGIGSGLARQWAGRSIRPLATILLFLLLSQAMLKGGFLDSLSGLLSLLDPGFLAPIVALIAGISGYLTGSNIGGNAIAMPAISGLETPGAPWLAAIQNSGAGHGALGSLPMIALVSGLAGLTSAEERKLVRYGLLLVGASIALIALSGTVLVLVA